MAVIITGNNTPTAGGITYGDGSTYANTAAGTSGQPVVSGGAGAPVFRPYTLPPADGSASQVLQTNGSGALSFATPAAGALTLLSTVTPSASATVDIETTFNSTYDVYIIQATGVTMATRNVGLYCRFKIGGSYVACGTPYSYAADHTGQADTSYQIFRSTGADQIEVVAAGDIGSASTEYTTFEMRIDQVASTALYKTVTWVGMSLDTSGVYLNQRGGGRITNAGALTRIRFLSTSGNIAAGKFRLYGLANS